MIDTQLFVIFVVNSLGLWCDVGTQPAMHWVATVRENKLVSLLFSCYYKSGLLLLFGGFSCRVCPRFRGRWLVEACDYYSIYGGTPRAAVDRVVS